MKWAMNQATGDPRSQCLLYVIADCANPDGMAFPSVKFMAAKSQQSKATVQRRLKELEDMGAIARFPRWEDEDGKVNSEGRGRRTSDEIRLLFDAHIDRKSADDDHAGGSELSTSPSQAETGGSQPETLPVAQLSDGPPSHCRDPIVNRQNEPNSSPYPLPGGREPDPEGWEDFRPAIEADGEPIARVSIAKQLFAALSNEERKLVTQAAKGLIAWRSKQKKPPAKVSAQTLIRERDSWASWAKHTSAEAKPQPPRITIRHGDTAWRGLCVIKQMWNRSRPGSEVVFASAIPALESLAGAFDLPQENWVNIFETAHNRQAQGWRERLAKCGFQMPPSRPIATGRVHEVLGPERVHGWTVPTEWPPRMDGTLASTGPLGGGKWIEQLLKPAEVS
jgi:Helix-turn-helix domain